MFVPIRILLSPSTIKLVEPLHDIRGERNGVGDYITNEALDNVTLPREPSPDYFTNDEDENNTTNEHDDHESEQHYWIKCTDFSCSGNYFLICDGKSISIFDCHSGMIQYYFDTQIVCTLAKFSLHDDFVFVCSETDLKVFNVVTQEMVKTFNLSLRSPIASLGVFYYDTRIVFGTIAGSCYCLDTRGSGTRMALVGINPYSKLKTTVCVVATTTYSNRFAVSNQLNVIFLFELKNSGVGKQIGVFDLGDYLPLKSFTSLRFSPDEKNLMVTCPLNESAWVAFQLDTSSGKIIFTHNKKSQDVVSPSSSSSSSKKHVTDNNGKNKKLWGVGGYSCRGDYLIVPGANVGKPLIVATKDGRVEETLDFEGSEQVLHSHNVCCFSPTSDLLVTCGDECIIFWGMKNEEEKKNYTYAKGE